MTGDYSTIDVETENNRVKNYLYFIQYTSNLYYNISNMHIYQLCYYEGYIQMTGNYSTMDMEK